MSGPLIVSSPPGGGGGGGVTQILAGTGVSVSPVGGTGIVTVTNAGVTSAIAGSGISVSGATGAVTIGNTGVLSTKFDTGAALTGAVVVNSGTGISTSTAGNTVTVTNAGVTSNVAGAGISVSGATGAVTVTNTWGAYPLTTTGDIVYANAATTNTRLGIGSALQVLQTNSGATAPQWAASPQSVLTTTGDVLYASAANTLARLGIGAEDLCLTVSAGVPVWEASATSTLTTTGDLLYASAANTLARLAVGSGTQLLGVSAGIPAWVAAPAAGNFTLISDQVLGSAAASVTFSSIPGTYKHLVLMVVQQGSTPGQAELQFNSDTGTNYAWRSRNAGTTGTADTSIHLVAVSGVSLGLTSAVTYILDYTDTTFKQKTTISATTATTVDTSATAPNTDNLAGTWAQAAGTAITAIKVLCGTGNFNTGSRFTLYGLS